MLYETRISASPGSIFKFSLSGMKKTNGSGKPTHIQILLAPAAAGKTAYVLELARVASRQLNSTPRIVVPSHLQVRAWRRRVAQAGGAMGIRVFTFDQLFSDCLMAAGEVYTELSEPVQYRLIRAIVDELPLTHYASIRDRPGFIQILSDGIAELKAARAVPLVFQDAINALGGEPRLRDLGAIYAAYQDRLAAHRWADRAGLGWLAVEALDERAHHIAREWSLLVVDGFDSFTPIQLAFLQVLAGRVGRFIVTLTGAADGSGRALAHRRFQETRKQLEESLGVTAEPLLRMTSFHRPELRNLEENLFRPTASASDPSGPVELIEAPDRASEVRAALRWIKARLVIEKMHVADVALLSRVVSPYRSFILETAAEYGLPIRIVGGMPLLENPAVAALLMLLRILVPDAEGASKEIVSPALLRREVVEMWRSPYFDWSARLSTESDPNGTVIFEPIGILPADADALDAAARWGKVIGGLDQWEEALSLLARRTDGALIGDHERDFPGNVPVGDAARKLLGKFRRFLLRISPPRGLHSFREWTGWLETLVGPDETVFSAERADLERETPRQYIKENPKALRVIAQARDAPESVAGRDVAALQRFKDVLRGLVWSEEALSSDQTETVPYTHFVRELLGSVHAASYHLPVSAGRDEILVADVIQARGLPFRAVAILGLAEGEFPRVLGEDPLLWDADRKVLRERFGIPTGPSTESAELEYFYEAVTRPRERLLLTRPRIADNGSAWQPSPYWEEIRRLVRVRPTTLTSESLPRPHQAASWVEVMESLAAGNESTELRDWLNGIHAERIMVLEEAQRVVCLRSGAPGTAGPGAHDGDLTGFANSLASQFHPDRMWSASRLEAYLACPHFFFVRHVLGLEPREAPSEGLDPRQLGNIYHAALEGVYKHAAVDDPSDPDQLLSVLPEVLDDVFANAPEREGFRETAWWAQTREEIRTVSEISLRALAELPGDFVPYQFEAAFGLWGTPALVIRDGDDHCLLCGLIDRIDRAPDGRLRIIDYKTAGPSRFSAKALVDGKKLQLPLYALGARDGLGLGEPVEGFYWHIRQARPSAFTLAKFGSDEAMRTGVVHAWAAIRGVRSGAFVPRPPVDGCPSFCPAAGFCWHFDPWRW